LIVKFYDTNLFDKIGLTNKCKRMDEKVAATQLVLARDVVRQKEEDQLIKVHKFKRLYEELQQTIKDLESQRNEKGEQYL
jgi:hypothetical protein